MGLFVFLKLPLKGSFHLKKKNIIIIAQFISPKKKHRTSIHLTKVMIVVIICAWTRSSYIRQLNLVYPMYVIDSTSNLETIWTQRHTPHYSRRRHKSPLTYVRDVTLWDRGLKIPINMCDGWLALYIDGDRPTGVQMRKVIRHTQHGRKYSLDWNELNHIGPDCGVRKHTIADIVAYRFSLSLFSLRIIARQLRIPYSSWLNREIFPPSAHNWLVFAKFDYLWPGINEVLESPGWLASFADQVVYVPLLWRSLFDACFDLEA